MSDTPAPTPTVPQQPPRPPRLPRLEQQVGKLTATVDQLQRELDDAGQRELLMVIAVFAMIGIVAFQWRTVFQIARELEALK